MMLTRFASNVVLSKARAMFGKRLTPQDYESLLACKGVDDILAYLKTHTTYADILSEIAQGSIHRGYLEATLRKQLYYDFARLCRYEFSVGEHFSQYLLERTEITETIHVLTLLNTAKNDEYVHSLPSYFEAHTKINLRALVGVQTYDEFLQAYEHSEYYEILKRNSPKDGKGINLGRIEHELDTLLYKNVFETIDKFTSGQQQKELMAIFQNMIDLSNFIRILRLKKYFHQDPERITEYLIPYGAISGKSMNKLLAAEDSAALFKIMMATRSGRGISKMKYEFASEIIKQAKYNNSKKGMRFSVYPSVVLISYIFAKETEISNIISIIEGTRYEVPAKDIKKILVLD